MTLQEVVRGMSWLVWTPGHSKCYKNTSYTRTKKKVSFKFDKVHVKGYEHLPGKGNFSQVMEISRQKEEELRVALVDAGFAVSQILIFDYIVQVWLEPTPVTVIDGTDS